MYRVVEFFSGIGSQAKALKNLNIEFKTVGTCEWDVHAIVAYDLIHNRENTVIPFAIKNMSKSSLLELLSQYTFSNTGKSEIDFSSLKTYSTETLQKLLVSIQRNSNLVDINSLKGSQMPDDTDLLTYSFPCQDLSNVGAFHGYNKGIEKNSGSRSSLLWQVGRILNEMKASDKKMPKFLLMENVPTLLSSRHINNFSTWICDLNELGYISKYYLLNAVSFGLPQNRPRLLMISVYVSTDQEKKDLILDYFKLKDEEAVVNDYRFSSYYKSYSVEDLLCTDYTRQELYEEAIECTPNDTPSRKKIWDENPQIVLPGYELNSEISEVRTITTKQDRNPNSGNLYFDCDINGKSRFRYLTPRECMQFMGFTDEDYDILKKNNIEFHKGDRLFSRDKIYRMAGNSIPVKLLEGIFLQIVKIDSLISELQRHPSQAQIDSETEFFSKRIRSYLFSKGIRCRQVNDISCGVDADIFYPKYNTAIYINNCFRHGHNCELGKIPADNNEFWKMETEKIRTADSDRYKEAEENGWEVIVIWECELLGDNITESLEKIASQLGKNQKKGID